jgi:hypothetical protein
MRVQFHFKTIFNPIGEYTMTANSTTDVSGSASAADIAAAAANSAAAQAAAAVAADAASSYQRDYSGQSSVVTDNDKDTGTDERYEVESADRSSVAWLNAKRTYDQYQSIDHSVLVDAQVHKVSLGSSELMSREQTLLHQAKLNALEIEMKQAEHNQRLRHADFQVTALAAVTKEMIDSIADRVTNQVCSRMGK